VIVYAGKTLFQGDEVLSFCLSCAHVRMCVRLCVYVSLCMFRFFFGDFQKKKGGFACLLLSVDTGVCCLLSPPLLPLVALCCL
jgi:hypothetical protein